jgi:putative DNA primase/helicase
MTQTAIIQNQQVFITNATDFFITLFEPSLNTVPGDIEIKTFQNNQAPQQFFCQSESEASQISYNLCNSGIDVYVGVNPRVGKAGKKANIHYLAAFHAEIDYGQAGHKSKSEYDTYEETLAVINKFSMKPTILNHSGGGFHCYWVFNNPMKVEETGIANLEKINKKLLKHLGGDIGTHDITRVLRVPGTFNLKLAGNPREAVNLWLNGPQYSYKDFKWLIEDDQTIKNKMQNNAKNKSTQTRINQIDYRQDIDRLPVSERIKTLILNGNDWRTYPSRSEADQAVITALVNKGLSETNIKSIFENYKIGEKYREHKSPDQYLKHNIEKAKDFSHLTEDERLDPLFITGSLHKDNNGKFHLKIVPFQEYMNKKHTLRYLEKEKAFFRYNGQCFEQCNEERLNFICQQELQKHRGLFTKTVLSSFMHFSIADDLVDAEKVYLDQVRYLTLQNGLYDLGKHCMISHTKDIFTTNLLPYDYHPEAQCPRWLQYLNEVFKSDQGIINFVQEAIGYAFHKAIPKPALFFLVGSGSNGKSVFINTLSSLCGKENVSNISLNFLSNEIYILDLFGKMINVSSETPNKKCINTDLMKAVVAGDWVTGRELYKRPSKFQPFAKHYLAMNELPNIDDNTHGMWRRIHVIEFPHKFTEDKMDVELTEKLGTELSGIFNWALEGYKRLRMQKFIFSESQSMQATKKNYKTQSNSVLDYIARSFVKADDEHSVALKDEHERYQCFCEDEGHKNPYTKKEFRNMLEQEGFKIENSSRHSNQVRIFGAKNENILECSC